MCIGIFKDPGKFLIKAAKEKNTGKTALILGESAIIFAVAVSIMLFKISGFTQALAMTAVYVFVLIIGLGLIGGYIIKTIANTLGARGGFFEGLTSISASLVPVSAGFLASTIISIIPTVGVVFGAIVFAIMLSMGVALLYRSIKELYKIDMITSFVVVSIFTVVIVVGIYSMVVLNYSIGNILPV